MVDLLKRVVLVFKLRQSDHNFARYIGKVGNTGILLAREKNAQILIRGLPAGVLTLANSGVLHNSCSVLNGESEKTARSITRLVLQVL